MPNPVSPFQEDNFFSEEEYTEIYTILENIMKKGEEDLNDKYGYMKKLTNNGFIAIFFSELRNQDKLPKLSDALENKIKAKFEEVAKEPVDHIGIAFARYTLDSGDIPSLLPHCDRSETHVSYTFTVELDKSKPWDFYVEDQKFDMKPNSAIWFSGTHQSHWRPDANFDSNDFYDIFLCQTHLSSDGSPLPEDHYDNGDQISVEFAEKYSELLKDSLEKAERINGACQ
jgi:hypothetical protein